jgi:putative transposase
LGLCVGISIAIISGMPYLPRYHIIDDDSYFHVTWQCHNKDWLLRWDWAKQIYYDLLLKYKDKFGITFHSYNFMDNHPHLIGHLRTKDEFSAFFRVVNCQLAKRINRQLKRRGQVVMDRFKSPKIESDEYMHNAMIYSDLNQYRAGKVKHPRHNTWSSYSYYAYGTPDPLITPSPSYLALDNTPEERQLAYRGMVEALITHPVELNISHTYFIGNPDWVIAKYKELRMLLREKLSSRRKSLEFSG